MPTDWATFYIPFFPTPREAREFVADLAACRTKAAPMG
jgi:hypothetical protein